MALKVNGPAFPADKEELKRFAQVIRKVAALHHENLVRWWAAGKTAEYVWISQELIEGESLAHLLSREETPKLKWRHALKLGIDIAKGLVCIHDRQMVHGNLTPANVIVGQNRVAKLNDLMFDQALKGSAWHRMGMEKKLLLDLPYTAPECLEENAYCDRGADIYSLGALIYARLTGRAPFEAPTPGDTIAMIQEGRLENPRKIVRECPEALQTAILKMMSTSQESRFQSAGEVVNELERIQSMP